MLNLVKPLIAMVTAISLSWTLVTVSAAPAAAPNGVCTGTVGAQRFESLEVPANASCTLQGTRIDGNLIVGVGATLRANAVTVGGNVQAEGAASVSVTGTATVGGSIQIRQGGDALVDQVQVTGNIQLEANRAALAVTQNRVGGSVQIFQNTGGASISDNRIDGNLQCKENVPAPTGARNQAASLENQCAGFAGTPAQPSPTPPPTTPVAPTPTATPAPTTTPNGDGICRGSIDGQRFENLEVPADASCTLRGVRVDGNLTVGRNATLHAIEVVIGGNLQAGGAADVTINNNSTVGGSIQIKQGGSATVDQVMVTGDIQLESNQRGLSASRNQVGGNVQIFQNTGGATITDNRIDGNLQCKENVPAPVGGRNQAASLEDQCAGFAGEPAINSPAPGVDGVRCEGSIGAEQYTSVTVPASATCALLGTRVSGNLIIGAGATLQASGVVVQGTIQAQGATVVTVHNNSMVGGIQIRQSGSAIIDEVQVTGDLHLAENQRSLSVTRSRIGGSVQAIGNQAGIVVRHNTVDGALQCRQNVLLPLAGANQAASLEEQCAELNQRLYLPVVRASQ